VRKRRNARRAVHVDCGEVVLALQRLARVNPDPNLHPDVLGPLVFGEHQLARARALDRTSDSRPHVGRR
jgi:hypothetical protein